MSAISCYTSVRTSFIQSIQIVSIAHAVPLLMLYDRINVKSSIDSAFINMSLVIPFHVRTTSHYASIEKTICYDGILICFPRQFIAHFGGF